MRFKLDENMPRLLAAELCAAGHDAHTCQDEGIDGAGDPAIARHASEQGRVLITGDLDFSDIRIYPPGSCPGIIRVRLSLPNIPSIRAAIARVFVLVPEVEIHGNLVVVDENRIRIRRPAP